MLDDYGPRKAVEAVLPDSDRHSWTVGGGAGGIRTEPVLPGLAHYIAHALNDVRRLFRYFCRRSSSRSTASRMNSDRFPVPHNASIRARTSGDKRMAVYFTPSGGRPIAGVLAVTQIFSKGLDLSVTQNLYKRYTERRQDVIDMDALVANVKAKREATGLGLNVRFEREDGTPDCFSFADKDRADRFREKLVRTGRKMLP